MIPESKYPKSARLEKHRSMRITLGMKRMMTAVEFYDQSVVHAGKIGNVAPDRVLSPKLCTRELPIAQCLP